jgi:hypothetical protein
MKDIVIRTKELGAPGYKCRGAWAGIEDCPYKDSGYWRASSKKIPKGTVMLQILEETRWCPSCAKKILPELEKQIAECRKVFEETEEETSSGVSLLRSSD